MRKRVLEVVLPPPLKQIRTTGAPVIGKKTLVVVAVTANIAVENARWNSCLQYLELAEERHANCDVQMQCVDEPQNFLAM
jgi:hypothetical protein